MTTIEKAKTPASFFFKIRIWNIFSLGLYWATFQVFWWLSYTTWYTQYKNMMVISY